MNDDNWKITEQHPKEDEVKENKLFNVTRFLQTNN